MEPRDIEADVEHRFEYLRRLKHVGSNGVCAKTLLQPLVEELGSVVEDVADDVGRDAFLGVILSTDTQDVVQVELHRTFHVSVDGRGAESDVLAIGQTQVVAMPEVLHYFGCLLDHNGLCHLWLRLASQPTRLDGNVGLGKHLS